MQIRLTLYYFMKDTAGQSTCTGACITLWPAFSTDPITAPSSLNIGDFKSISRTEVMKQTAFTGGPLYYYTHDKKPGEREGFQ